MKFDRAMLLTYTAPPPPLTRLGRDEVELVNAEQIENAEFKMRTVRPFPLNFSTCGGDFKPEVNSDSWAV